MIDVFCIALSLGKYTEVLEGKKEARKQELEMGEINARNIDLFKGKEAVWQAEKEELNRKIKEKEDEARQHLMDTIVAEKDRDEARGEVARLRKALNQATNPPAEICLYPAITIEPTPTPPPPEPLPAPSPTSASPASTPQEKSRMRAMVVHGLPCHRRLDTVARDLGAIGRFVETTRWLVGEERRQGKATSSVVLYFNKIVSVEPTLKIRGKRHRVSRYEFGRKNEPGQGPGVKGRHSKGCHFTKAGGAVEERTGRSSPGPQYC